MSARIPNSAGNLPSHELPIGVMLRPLVMHGDERGVFTELFRETWDTGVEPVQWNLMKSKAGVLRGMHVHIRHDDYVIVLQGHASVGLRDLRRGSPTEGVTAVIELRGAKLMALTIPQGVAHGFFFHEPSLLAFAVSEYWDSADELGCYWADPALRVSWPTTSPSISERDAALPPLIELVGLLPPYKAR